MSPPFTGETENRRETNRFLGNLQRRSEKASNHTVSPATLLRATWASGPTDIPAGKKSFRAEQAAVRSEFTYRK